MRFNNIQTATAQIMGSKHYPNIHGKVRFNRRSRGVLVTAEIFGLPNSECSECDGGIFAFHIHEGSECSGDASDLFKDAGAHFNPDNCMHPYHAGDLPPLIGNNGYAYMSVLTNRFKISDIIGRTVIIHKNPDDFHTQPSGNAGEKIACGVIKTCN